MTKEFHTVGIRKIQIKQYQIVIAADHIFSSRAAVVAHIDLISRLAQAFRYPVTEGLFILYNQKLHNCSPSLLPLAGFLSL